ncbi:hypothetical protein LX32DRAFT_185044 [Colletotrichum zoysiae]|uniref:Uncharacterized protein n=1 Tax=Colletotrichum zoysiae TaxID=1216348 RepID=A0AAD9H598_9PEZI|nr:hypothetical protein LX32DRAFT_185044 [Colletotrichum zoysiae]
MAHWREPEVIGVGSSMFRPDCQMQVSMPQRPVIPISLGKRERVAWNLHAVGRSSLPSRQKDGGRSGHGPRLPVNQSDVQTFAPGREPTVTSDTCVCVSLQNNLTGTFTYKPGAFRPGGPWTNVGLTRTREQKATSASRMAKRRATVSPGLIFHFTLCAMAISDFTPPPPLSGPSRCRGIIVLSSSPTLPWKEDRLKEL